MAATSSPWKAGISPVRQAWWCTASALRSTSPTQRCSWTTSSGWSRSRPLRVRWFVLDAQAMIDVDTTGAGVLGQAITLLKKRNITLAVSPADRSSPLLARTGTI